MTRSQPVRRVLLVATVLSFVLAASAQGAALAVDDETSPPQGKTPKPFRSLDFRWYADETESAMAGSDIPAYGDLTAVGVAFTNGARKARNTAVKQGFSANTAVGDRTKVRKRDLVAHVVANMAGATPKKLKTDAVLVVTTDGAGSVPLQVGDEDSLTAGSAYGHVIGRYGSQRGAPILTADDDTSGDAPGGTFVFGDPSTGAGGYDPATTSYYTSFVVPPDARNLSVSFYTTQDGFQLDRLPGEGHTERVPIEPVKDPFICAKIDVFPRHDADGGTTGVYDVKAALQLPIVVDLGTELSPHGLAFEFQGGGAATSTEVVPESPPGSNVYYWHGTVDRGSADPGVLGVSLPDTRWRTEDEISPPAAVNAFEGLRLQLGPEARGTIYGNERCGNMLEFEGCAHGGGTDFWSGLVEAAGQPAPTGTFTEFPIELPGGAPYCIVVDESTNEPYVVFGLDPRPYTLDGHRHAMESAACDQTPIDPLAGGTLLECADGSVTFRWLETGSAIAADADLGWGFRPEVTVLPVARDALAWADGEPLTSDDVLGVYQYDQEYARALLEEAGWVDTGDGYQFGADAVQLDGFVDDGSDG